MTEYEAFAHARAPHLLRSAWLLCGNVVTAMNAGSADPTLPVMDEPVLTLSELTAIAQDPAWR